MQLGANRVRENTFVVLYYFERLAFGNYPLRSDQTRSLKTFDLQGANTTPTVPSLRCFSDRGRSIQGTWGGVTKAAWGQPLASPTHTKKAGRSGIRSLVPGPCQDQRCTVLARPASSRGQRRVFHPVPPCGRGGLSPRQCLPEAGGDTASAF